MKALVTGATGFIGSHLAEVLADKGWEVRALVRETSDVGLLNRIGAELVVGDIRDKDSLKDALAGREIIFHCAALVGEWGEPVDFYNINVGGMKNLIDEAEKAGVKRVIDVSSTSVHGYEGFKRDTEESPYISFGILYSDTKQEAEKLLWEAHAQGRIEATSIRPAMVWGPRDQAFFAKFIKLLKKKQFVYIDGGRHIAGLTHVRNVCDAMFRSAQNPNSIGKAFIITDDNDITYRDVVEKLCDELGFKKPRLSISYSAAKFIAYWSEKYARRKQSEKAPILTRMGVSCIGNDLSFDITRAKTILGYAPRYSFPQSLPEYLEWLKSQNNI
ncbi:MAG: NAD-dependent epimerase/dehydratase family protein [bacterium]